MGGDKQKTILCYGDSNTWGFVSGSADYEAMTMKRYPRNMRWPGLLQNLLGDEYHVVEEGLNGRTTNLEYKFPPDRNGETYLSPCLYSHAPIDLVVLSLGGNDLMAYFNRSVFDVYQGLGSLVRIIQSSQYGHDMREAPKVLIVSQPIPLPISEEFVDDDGIVVFEGVIEKAKSLVKLYSKLAIETGCYFLDISLDLQLSEIDGIHLNERGHETFATLIKNEVSNIFVK